MNRVQLSSILVVLLCSVFCFAQVNPSLYDGMRWRQVGPFRAGRVTAVAGIPGDPAVYYMGTPGGGVWQTTDGGMVWKPIFDQEHISSIGALVVAPSNPKIIYVGTGDVSNVGGSVNYGDGIYKSTDGGKNWQHIGLERTEKIGAMYVDPHNPDVVVVAALGQTYARNPERGIFKTEDGGKNWRKVLYTDDATGAIDLAFDPTNPKLGFAATWGHFVQPGNMRALIDSTGGGAIYKTEDGGDTWTALGNPPGWPTEKLGRIGVAVAPGGKRLFAIVSGRNEGGLYRSDDAGASWKKITDDRRVQGNGYFSKVFLDPNNPDIVYVGQTSLYRSTDGGRTFISYKGAPGGDDNHVLWIDPTNSDHMILGSDQGATISMDGGISWSSWYNQPTGQIYHLSTDNRFPYWIYGTQQDSGSVATLSRGDYGEITFLDWDPIGGYEFGYIIPDPTNPNMVYAGGPGRGLVRIDRSNRQVKTVSPNVSRDGDFRTAVNPPLAFSPQDSHVLYEGTQFLLQTTDGGLTWKKISPDLTKRPGSAAAQAKTEQEQAAQAATPKKPKTKEEEETLKPPDRTSINTFAASPVRKGVIWAGTTNGIVQLTRDGGSTWHEVSPRGLSEHSEISMLEASHFDPATAYAAVINYQLNDFKPHVFRTHDFGSSWQETDAGFGKTDFVRVVREDPARKGLLYAGTENAAYVSFDDGDHWSSMQLNLPTTSVRDLVVHGDELVAATYGRAFWILDDLAPLRQISDQVAQSDVFLYKPAKAMRVQLDMNQDTPLPPEMPAGDNPPDGAILDYYLKAPISGDVTLAIYDQNGQLVRELSSRPEPQSAELPPPVPDYWVLRPEPLSKRAGMNRVVWDLRYPAPPSLRHEYPISALLHGTPGEPQGPLVVPGKYEVRLSVDGKTYKQPLEVTLDPRVKTTQQELVRQLDFDRKIDALIASSYKLREQAEDFRDTLTHREKALENNPSGKTALESLKQLDAKELKIEGEERRSFTPGKPKPTFTLLNQELGSLSTMVEGADAAPTSAMQTAYGDYCHDLTTVVSKWNDLMTKDVPALNAKLGTAKGEELPDPPTASAPSCQ